jgi:hypothetical protein
MKKTLTTTAIIIGYFFLMSSLGIIASVPHSVHKNAKEMVRNQIARNITCPDFVTENSEANTVKAIVSVDEQGRVSVGQINSGNAPLKDYVLNQLQSMQVQNPAGPEKFVLVINFKVN